MMANHLLVGRSREASAFGVSRRSDQDDNNIALYVTIGVAYDRNTGKEDGGGAVEQILVKEQDD